MKQPGDDELRDYFAQTRSADQQQAPAFEALLADTRPPRHRRAFPRPMAMLAAGIAIAAAYVALRPRPTLEDRRVPAGSLTLDLRSTHWASPTDFLLETPGDALMRRLPTLRYPGPDLFEDPSLILPPDRPAPAPATRRMKS